MKRQRTTPLPLVKQSPWASTAAYFALATYYLLSLLLVNTEQISPLSTAAIIPTEDEVKGPLSTPKRPSC